ncbi:uncharacterized protein N0V89_011540 [Didymosphaeria variabile]|uniref:Uncharacterized protein n=1 Tax=Didymosphaeria variabile TaxID=1932322 RepID=A0A9W8X9Y1_9PLEO|nr:uncharacterized protein N0V89_011540 [Didymosphaeria variabile]KAJ4345410.1 hypothetical protein N0V89_011540 [Didymosphaeria variabile]
MAAEALKAYQEYMGGSAGSNNAQQQQQQGPQGQQPGANFQNPYAAGYGAHMQQVPQGIQNPYAAQQQYLQSNPVSNPDLYTYPLDLSKLSTALLPARSTDVQQFTRAHVPPAAPTPPPAVPQAAASNAALAQHGQLQPYIPQAPVGGHARHQGYVDLPRGYNPLPQSPGAGYAGGWHYNQAGPPTNQLGYDNAPAMAPVQPEPAYHLRDWSFESTRERNRSRYSGLWPPPDVVRIPSRPPPSKEVFPVPDVPPLALCHVCSVCGQMRSAGYHRHHPIIPGQALTSTPCRRCKKRARKAKGRREKESARQEETEPSENTITIKIDDGERRGRARARVVCQVDRHHSLSPERVVYRPSGRANVGLRESTRVEHRTAQDMSPESSPPAVLRRRTRSEVRISSVSPPPDGIRVRYRREEEYERQRSSSPDARARLAAHGFRTFTPTEVPGYYPEETHSPAPAPLRGILKNPSQFQEAQPTRHKMERSHDMDERGRTHYPHRENRREPSPLRRATSQLRDLGQRVCRRFSRSPTPQPNRKHEDWDDATDSDSEISGEHYWVRYHDVDENGMPATIYEERVKKALPAGGRHEAPALTRGFAPVKDR